MRSSTFLRSNTPALVHAAAVDEIVTVLLSISPSGLAGRFQRTTRLLGERGTAELAKRRDSCMVTFR